MFRCNKCRAVLSLKEVMYEKGKTLCIFCRGQAETRFPEDTVLDGD